MKFGIPVMIFCSLLGGCVTLIYLMVVKGQMTFGGLVIQPHEKNQVIAFLAVALVVCLLIVIRHMRLAVKRLK